LNAYRLCSMPAIVCFHTWAIAETSSPMHSVRRVRRSRRDCESSASRSRSLRPSGVATGARRETAAVTTYSAGDLAATSRVLVHTQSTNPALGGASAATGEHRTPLPSTTCHLPPDPCELRGGSSPLIRISETSRAFSRLAYGPREGSGLSHLYPGFSHVNRSAAPWSRGTSGSPMRDTFLSRSRSGSRSGSIYAARSEPPGRDMYIYAWRGAERRSGGGDSLWPLGSLVSCLEAAVVEPDAPGGRRGGGWLT
jgi:hypothetical protein